MKVIDDKAGDVGKLFLDSGAFSLFYKYAFKGPGKIDYSYYSTKEYWEYVDAYAKFVSENLDVIDVYANVDVIYNPDLTWRTQQYLEKKWKLRPIPVVHAQTPLEYISRYLKRGYEMMGIGGFGGAAATREAWTDWAADAWNLICPKPSRLPVIRVHGFAMTSHWLLTRFPWYSVDSASWIKSAAFGSVLLPYLKDDEFDFDHPPFVMSFSERSPSRKDAGRHFQTQGMGKMAQSTMIAWLKHIGIPVGDPTNFEVLEPAKVDKKTGKVREEKRDYKDKGVTCCHKCRALANLHYFESLCASRPKWPWPYHPMRKVASLGVDWGTSVAKAPKLDDLS